MVTLLGPGGIGKTSLAIEVHGRVGAEFGESMYFSDLASDNEPDGIVPARAARGADGLVRREPPAVPHLVCARGEAWPHVGSCHPGDWM